MSDTPTRAVGRSLRLLQIKVLIAFEVKAYISKGLMASTKIDQRRFKFSSLALV